MSDYSDSDETIINKPFFSEDDHDPMDIKDIPFSGQDSDHEMDKFRVASSRSPLQIADSHRELGHDQPTTPKDDPYYIGSPVPLSVEEIHEYYAACRRPPPRIYDYYHELGYEYPMTPKGGYKRTYHPSPTRRHDLDEFVAALSRSEGRLVGSYSEQGNDQPTAPQDDPYDIGSPIGTPLTGAALEREMEEFRAACNRSPPKISDYYHELGYENRMTPGGHFKRSYVPAPTPDPEMGEFVEALCQSFSATS